MRKRFIAMLLAIVMIMACVVPAGAYSYDDTDSGGEASTIVTVDLDEDEDDSGSTGTETTGTETGLSEEAQAIQDMISALPAASDITIDNYEDVIAQLDAIDEAKLELYYAGNTEIDYLDYTKYDAACVAIEQIETDIANGVYDEEEEGEDEDDSAYVDPAEPETPETDPDVAGEEEQEEQEEETVDYDQDAVDAFINAYLTSENVTYPFDESVSEENAVVYSEATEDNYEQILSGTDAWDTLSEPEQDAVNAIITAAYIAANPDEFDGMSEDEIASFVLTWDELVTAAEKLEEELAEVDMEAVNDFINTYLTDSSVTYPFTDAEIAAYAEYLVKVENGEEMEEDYIESVFYLYVYYHPYTDPDTIAAGESAWKALNSAGKNAINDIIESYAELREASETYTYSEMLETAKNIQEETASINDTVTGIDAAVGQDNEIELLEELGLEYVGTVSDEETDSDSSIMVAGLTDYDSSTSYMTYASFSTAGSYKYPQFDRYTDRFSVSFSDTGLSGYGVCLRPTLSVPSWSSGNLYVYTQTDALVAALVYSEYLNTETYVDSYLEYWSSDGGIIEYLSDIQSSIGRYAFEHETIAYILEGYSYCSYNGSILPKYTEARSAISTSANYIASNYNAADLSGWTVYIYVPNNTSTYQYVAFLVYTGNDEPVTAYVTKTSSGNATAVASADSGTYNLAGTVITIYSDSSRTQSVGTLTVAKSGSSYVSNTIELDPNTTYYWKETTTGAGYNNSSNLNKTGSFTTGDAGSTYNISISNTPSVTQYRIYKSISSDDASIVNAAASGTYSVKGAQYLVYTDSSCSNYYGTWTIQEDGYSNYLTFAIGTTYYFKESSTNHGTNLTQDTTVYNFTTSTTAGATGLAKSLTDGVIRRYVQFQKQAATGTTSDGISYSTIMSQGGDGNYTLSGATITVYTDSACTNVYATLTTGADGKTSILEIPVGTTLYWKETKAPTGFSLNSTKYTISASTTSNLTTGTVYVGTVTDNIITQPVRVHKITASGYEDWVTNNSCYDLTGTTIGVYTSAANARNDTNRVVTLTVQSDGYTNTVELARNTTYYFRELTAGTGYILDTTVYSAKTGTSGTTTVTMENVPGDDPLTITLTKTGYDGTTPVSAAGAVFSITYYGGIYSSESAAESAVSSSGVMKRTWYVQTVKVGNSYIAGILTPGSLLTSGDYVSDALFYDSEDVVVIPYGTVVIKEVSAPEGYLNDPTFTDSTGTEYGDVYIAWATEDYGYKSASTNNTITQAFKVYETIIPEMTTSLTGTTGLSDHKSQASTSTTLTDSVDITLLNDFIGKTVTIKGQLYYTDGTPVTINGSNIVATQNVKITSTEQTVTQTFTFDASSLDGQEVVCYEYFIYDGEVITEHTDPWDEDQIDWLEPIGPGSISVTKTDSEGNTLAGATYLLEYSTDDGTTWNPVYSYTTGAKDGYVAGGCSSSGLTDGMLTTGTDGVVTFSDLYADGSILYRLTEVQAPEGYTLLAESVYEGTLYVLADDSIDTTIYDVNGDGDITYADYRYLYRYVNEGGSAPASGTGDINKDGRINASDVTAIKAFLDDWTSGDTPFNRQFDIAYLVKDGSVFDMPLTGGSGTNWVPFVLAGMLGVMAGAGIYVLVIRKKKEDELPTA